MKLASIFSFVQRQQAHVAEAGVAGAEVVQGGVHAQGVKGHQGGARLVEVADDGGLGDLEVDAVRRDLAFKHDVDDAADGLHRGDVSCRQIDRNPHIHRPGADRAQGLGDQNPGDLYDLARTFGGVDEHGRWHIAQLGAGPARQGLEGYGALGAGIDDGLEVDVQFRVQVGATQGLFYPTQFTDIGLVALVEHHGRTLQVLLGVIKGVVGAFEQLLAGLAAGRERAEADGAGDLGGDAR